MIDPVKEGFVPVTGGRIYYRIFGTGPGTPLLALHGGPGYPSDSLEALADLGDERPVILYDQLGCGRADRPDDESLWVIERFVEEIVLLRNALNLPDLILFGHSWGTMLGVDYLLTRPQGVHKVVLSSAALSIPRWVADAQKLIAAMPPDVGEALDRHLAAGTTNSEEYRAAEQEYNKLHLFRQAVRPDPLQRALKGFSLPVYSYMWGPSEPHATGTLKTYDRVNRLAEIAQPVLMTCGRYDEATPASTEFYASHFPDARVMVFENSAHTALFEQQTDYIQTLREFLAE